MKSIVSVIIPTYNTSKYISEAVNSVLSQTYNDYEIIVVDDGSTDNTKDIIKKYENKIKYIYQNNKGISAARNMGIKEAKGDYVAFLDADDIWYPEKLSYQLSILENNSGIAIAGALMDVIDEAGRSLGSIKPKNSPGNTFESAIVNGSPAPSTFLIRRECFEDIGIFDEKLTMFEDLDMFLRIVKKYKAEISNIALGGYRIHISNITKDDNSVYLCQIVFAKKWLPYCLDKKTCEVIMKRLKKYSSLSARQFLKKGKVLKFIKYFLIAYFYKPSEKSNVLFIESGSGFGGSSKCLYLLLKHIDKNAIQPTVLCYGFGPNIEATRDLGVSIKKYSCLTFILTLLKVNMVYTNNELYSHFINLLIAKIFNKRCICHMRGIRPLTKREKIIVPFVDKFIAVSQTCRNKLIKEGIPQKKIEVVYDGVEIEKMIKGDDGESEIRIGVVSRLVPNKGLSIFVEAANILTKRMKSLKFFIFGDDTEDDKPTRKELERLIRFNNLNDSVYLKGWHSNTLDIYNNIDVAICPSQLEESFGMNVAEAMAFGKPTIASRIGAYSEIIQDKTNGLLCSPGDAQDLASKIESVVNDYTLRKELSLQARKAAIEKFDIKINVAKIKNIIEEN